MPNVPELFVGKSVDRMSKLIKDIFASPSIFWERRALEGDGIYFSFWDIVMQH